MAKNAAVPRRTGPFQAENVTPARRALAENLRRIFAEREINSSAVAKKSGIAQRTIHDMLMGAHDPGLGKIDKVAQALGLHAWQLLHSAQEAKAIELVEVYMASTAEARAIIDFAVDAARRQVKESGGTYVGRRDFT